MLDMILLVCLIGIVISCGYLLFLFNNIEKTLDKVEDGFTSIQKQLKVVKKSIK
jgi:uncharacterized protein YoxC